MKNRVFIFLTLIIVTFLSSAVLGQGETAPEIFFKEKTFIADKVMEGTPIVHTYTVYNRGTALLRIKRVRPG